MRLAIIVPFGDVKYVTVADEPGVDLAAVALDKAENLGHIDREAEQVAICPADNVRIYRRGWHSDALSEPGRRHQLQELAADTPHTYVVRTPEGDLRAGRTTCELCGQHIDHPIHKLLPDREVLR